MNRFDKRGMPKKDSQGSKAKGRSYWLGEVFIDHGGCAWPTELVEKAPIDGRRCWEALPICLGREDEIVPILKGEKPVPEDMDPRRRKVLGEIAEPAGEKKVRSNKYDDRTKGFSFGKRASRSFRGHHRYRV